MLRLPEIRCSHIPPWDGGSLDALGSAWSEAGRLYLSENSTGRRPQWGTEVRIGWEERALLVLFLCQDPNPWATLTERDQPLWEEEVVEVFLDPFGDRTCYFEFEVNPLNAVADVFIRRTRTGLRKDFNWDCDGLITAAGRLSYGWVAALQVPFPALGDCQPRGTWRANFCRIERPENRPRELSSWSPTHAGTFHVPERFGLLHFE
jgi:cellulose/xylan binding protein with CBM9 domain